jgi:DNA-binding beta-propeller fold protein YncE
MRNAQKMYYDENGNQVYVFNQGSGASQVTIRNPGNGNIVTNMNSTDGYVNGKLESGDWFELN